MPRSAATSPHHDGAIHDGPPLLPGLPCQGNGHKGNQEAVGIRSIVGIDPDQHRQSRPREQ